MKTKLFLALAVAVLLGNSESHAQQLRSSTPVADDYIPLLQNYGFELFKFDISSFAEDTYNVTFVIKEYKDNVEVESGGFDIIINNRVMLSEFSIEEQQRVKAYTYLLGMVSTPRNGASKRFFMPSDPSEGCLNVFSCLPTPRKGCLNVFSSLLTPRKGCLNVFSCLPTPRKGCLNVFSRLLTPRKGCLNVFSRLLTPRKGCLNVFSCFRTPRKGCLNVFSCLRTPRMGL